MLILLSLKTDLEAADDEALAVRELQALAAVPPRRVRHTDAAQMLGLRCAPTTWAKRTLYACEVQPFRIDRLRRRLAFWETIYWKGAETQALTFPAKTTDGVSSCLTVSSILETTVRLRGGDPVATQICRLIDLNPPLGLTNSNGGGQPSPAVRRKNDYLTHPIHKYKAKFFPRLARSLVNIVCPDDSATILDPFSGSGTAPLEASLMGLRSIGYDLDPLSVFIGRVKCELEDVDSVALAEARDDLREIKISARQYSLFRAGSQPLFKVPKFLIVRKPARFPAHAVEEFEIETNALLASIYGSYNGSIRDWLLLALSHALSTKISLRWMGTGDDRFALEVAKRPLRSIFSTHLNLMVEKVEVYHALRDARILPRPAETKFDVHDSTTASLLRAKSIDGICTSPPYLPAASGRETYLRSRAISLVALGLLTEEQVLERERDILGSILAVPKSNGEDVPATVQSLTSWMINQRARGPKALPTVAYFERLAASLREIKRVLRIGKQAAIVVSKYHRFYELVSRKTVWEFDMSAAVAEVASERKYGVNMNVDEIVDIELPKMDYVARPGAKGSYQESIIFLRRT